VLPFESAYIIPAINLEEIKGEGLLKYKEYGNTEAFNWNNKAFN
jgi:hypothetical protein